MNSKRDENRIPTLLAVSNVDGITPITLFADPVTHRLLVDLPAGAGTVTSVSVVTANGISGSVATATTTPAITLTLGVITPTSVNGLTLASQAVGFTIAGGTTSKSLTVPLDASVSGTNTGDNATNSTSNSYADGKVEDSIVDGHTTIAPSGNAVFDALALKAPLTSPSFTTPTIGGVAIPSISSTDTFTNKRITQRVISATSYTTDTGTSLNADNCDVFRVTAQAGALLFNAPGGTPTDGQKLIISVASSTTAARALTWNAIFEASTTALPTTTAATTAQLNIGFIYSTPRTKWVCVAVA